jgi:formate hydrogenlyase subunit 4
MILYAAALKLWLFGALIVGLVIPRLGLPVVDLVLAVAGMLATAVVLGVIESTMARLRMVRVPELLVGAATLAALALVLEYGGVLS